MAVLLFLPADVRSAPIWGKNYRTGSGPSQSAPIVLASSPSGKLYALQAQELETWFFSSSDQGKTWSSPVSINPASQTVMLVTDLTVANNGTIYAVWHAKDTDIDNDIFFTHSTDGGETWSPNLNIIPVADRAANQVAPVIVVDPRDGRENMLYVAMRTYGVGVEHVQFISSSDGGSTWHSLITFPYPPDSSILKIEHLNMKMDSNGFLYLLFDETSTDDTRTFFTRSSDGGTTWDMLKPITPSPYKDGIYCHVAYLPSMALGGDDVIYVVYADGENGPVCGDGGTVKAQMMWIRSTDNGQNWSQPAIVGPSSLPEFPHDSLSLQVLPHTAVLDDDELFVVWLGKTDTTSTLLLHAIQSLDGGANWGEITNPSDAPDDATLNHIAPSTVIHQGQVQTAWLDKRVAGWYYPYTSRFAEPATSNTIYLPAVQNAPFTPTNTDSIAGEWTGTITNNKNGTSRLINVSVKMSCGFGAVCGSFSLPNSSCKGDLYLNAYNTGKFVFAEQNITGPSSCLTPGVVHLNSGSGGSLVYEAVYSQYTAGGFSLKYNGTLSHP